MSRGGKKVRWLDENLGPWILRLLAVYRGLLFTRRPFRSQNVKSLAIVKLAAIGDTVLLSAILADLRAWRPDLEITLFVGKSNYDYAKLLPTVTRVVLVEPKQPIKALQKFRQQQFDLLINADSWARISAIFSALSRAKFTLGFKTSGQNRHYADDISIPHDGRLHEIENYRNLLRRLEIPVAKAPAKMASAKDSRTVIFHLWPSGMKSHLREWPIESWITLGRAVLENPSVTLAFTGAPSEYEKNNAVIARFSPEQRERIKNLAGVTLVETIERLSGATAAVSVDTGVMHLAAAERVPVVSLHGPSNPKRWGPIGPRVYPIMSKLPMAGHLVLGFEYQTDENLMVGISPEEVFRVLQNIVSPAVAELTT